MRTAAESGNPGFVQGTIQGIDILSGHEEGNKTRELLPLERKTTTRSGLQEDLEIGDSVSQEKEGGIP